MIYLLYVIRIINFLFTKVPEANVNKNLEGHLMTNVHVKGDTMNAIEH